jgi:serine-type D-Ala-D-Ala carboxypeptidase/endopeptidase
MISSTRFAAVAIVSVLGAACSIVPGMDGPGGIETDAGATPAPGSDATATATAAPSTPTPPTGPAPNFGPLDAYLDERMAGGLTGYALQIYDATDKLVHQRQAGICATSSCPPNNPPYTTSLTTGIASSTKWLTSTTVLAVLEDGVAQGKAPNLDAALDTKIAPTLACAGVSGPVTDITMRHLLSFTSGVIAGHPCVTDRTSTLDQCACEILRDSAANMVETPSPANRKSAHRPGTTYKYGESHHAVAGAVVQKLTQKSWNEVFAAKVQNPLGTSMAYKSTKNLAGSVTASGTDYAKFVGAIFHDGLGILPKRLLSKEAVLAQRANQLPTGVVRLIDVQEGFDYGLNNWRWCYQSFDLAAAQSDPRKIQTDASCSAVFQAGHGGKGGYQPFLDAGGGKYYAVFSTREDSPGPGDVYTPEELGVTLRVRLLTHAAMTGTK